MDMTGEQTLYRLKMAASMLSVHPRTLKRWFQQGKIQLVVLPNGEHRISESELSRLVHGNGKHEG